MKLYTLTDELFIPGFMERDEGEREKPYDDFPWDGVSGTRPFTNSPRPPRSACTDRLCHKKGPGNLPGPFVFLAEFSISRRESTHIRPLHGTSQS